MLDTTSFTWIIAERSSVAHLAAMAQMLDELGAVADADLRILTVSEDLPVYMPAGLIGPDGSPLPEQVITVHNLPRQGILFQGTLP